MKNLFIFMFLLLNGITTAFSAQKVMPAPLLRLDQYFSHHVLVAEKSTHQLHIFKNNNGFPELLKTYKVVTGKKSGDKFFQGDHRTPEGIFHFTQFIPHEELVSKYGKEGEIYGVGAFVMNYPNPMDKKFKKTGYGIWLHSTNDETRIEKGLDSRGCIVAANNELKEISTYLELNKTPIIVVQDLIYLKEKTWQSAKSTLEETVESWRNAWENEDFDKYISHYHKTDFFDRYRGNYQNFRIYKRAVFSNPGKPQVNLDNISIFQNSRYAVVTFKQHYISNTINDTGKKTLYLKKDQWYQWKIVNETWNKLKENITDTIAFEPTMRFFKENQAESTTTAAKSN